MWTPDEYSLIDFGDGRKLEAFAGRLVNRPCPAAMSDKPKSPELWNNAAIDFDLTAPNSWSCQNEPPGDWKVRHGPAKFDIRTTPFGHLGLFPEQAKNWDWLQGLTCVAPTTRLQAINLFGYTGGTTLHLAAEGHSVTHVDASKPAVAWARDNARLSGLDSAPIRWIVDDAPKFVQRELRRGNQYQIVVLDPPAFGHGPNGERWELVRDLPQLLADCLRLLSQSPVGLLLTGHSEDIDAEASLHVAALEVGFQCPGYMDFDRSILVDANDRDLDFGYSLRWSNRRTENFA